MRDNPTRRIERRKAVPHVVADQLTSTESFLLWRLVIPPPRLNPRQTKPRESPIMSADVQIAGIAEYRYIARDINRERLSRLCK